jgi:uncharacterized membrane protein YhaH (DUF805 family)
LMQILRLLFSPHARLAPQSFVAIAIAIYAAGGASQLLTTPAAIARAGLWPFALAQALLIWVWFAVHAKRLSDAGRSVGLAAGVAVLYTLSALLLVIVAAAFYGPVAGTVPDANAASALGLILLVSILAILLGSPHYDLSSLLVVLLVLLAVVPIVLAVCLTVWAAMLPSAESRAA